MSNRRLLLIVGRSRKTSFPFSAKHGSQRFRFSACSKQTEVAVFRFQALLKNTNSCCIGAFKSQFEALLVPINKSLLLKKYKDIAIYVLFRNSEDF
jgi:hypothetical protein